MARKKVTDIPVLESFQQVNVLVRNIGMREAERARLEAELTEEINKVKKKYQAKVTPLIETVREEEAKIKRFCEFHREAFTGKKSMKLDFGTVGFRQSTKLETLKGWKWNDVAGKLRELKLEQFLKITYQVKKDDIKNSGRTEEELKTYGVKVNQDDEFYYEPDQEKIASMPDMSVLRKTG